jgi:hypothetical protein
VKRFALILLGATTTFAALGFVWALVRDRPVGHAIGVFLFIAAGLVFAVALGGGVSPHPFMDLTSPAGQLRHQQEKEQAVADGFGLLALAILLVVLGTLAQKYL